MCATRLPDDLKDDSSKNDDEHDVLLVRCRLVALLCVLAICSVFFLCLGFVFVALHVRNKTAS